MDKFDKFEYKTFMYNPKGFVGGKVDEDDFQENLNTLGAMGWDLVSCVASAEAYGQTRHLICVFKRRIGS